MQLDAYPLKFYSRFACIAFICLNVEGYFVVTGQ